MQVAAGLGAPEGKFTRLISHKFDFRDPVPVTLQTTVIIFPGIFEKGGSLSHDKFQRVSVQQKAMGGVKGSGLKNYGIPFIDDNSRWRITVFFGFQGYGAGFWFSGKKLNRQGDDHCQDKAHEY
jgi:hypothetical protein